VQKLDIAFGPGAAATKPFPSWSTINRDQGSSSNGMLSLDSLFSYLLPMMCTSAFKLPFFAGNADAPGLREKEYIEPWVGEP
jgi:DNA-directed RNA polymerase III subunit RPC4